MTLDSLQIRMSPGDGASWGGTSSNPGLAASLRGKIFKNLSADPIMDPSNVTCTMYFLLNKKDFSSLVSNYHILLSNRIANITEFLFLPTF
jgi:hypothetical protein